VKAEGVALVTGAGRGLGAAVALELSRRGFDVVATMRDPSAGRALVARAEGRLRVAALDVTHPETVELPDGLRVLVNNAGVDRAYLPVEHAPTSLWREMFETNLFGLVEVTRRAIPKLRAAGGGVVCNITSASLFSPVPFFAAYRASKAAVSALSESLRTEVARFGIRVVEITPGPIATEMLASSERPPEAAEHAGYERLAAWLAAGRKDAGEQTTPPEAAAARIADAILDDDAPLRNACDPLGEGLLQAWYGGADEALMRAILLATREDQSPSRKDVQPGATPTVKLPRMTGRRNE
jgi:NAD(P)-dependent dehydrogenase (short-subunit alcohol dehydrogenase family)